MRKFLSLLVLSFMTVSVFGGPRSVEDMMNAARKVLNPRLASRSADKSRSLEVLKTGRMLNVIGYKSGGFAVIATDDKFAPVLGYSDTQFATDDMPPAMMWWMDMAEHALQTALDGGYEITPAAELRSGKYPEAVGELLTTRWDQSMPYNKELLRITGKNYPTGCMATAMAQIMKYHSYPVTGQGYKGYAIDGKNGNYDFENTTYRYDRMLDVYSANNYTAEQADAVAKLMLHCGVAVDMNYGLSGSGSFSSDATTALNEYFKYDSRLYSRDIYTKAEWMDIIFDEISNGRPILYGGVTAQNAGHAFVFDGYDAEGLVHVNWGWSGSGNGYFEVALLNSNTGSYSYGQDMILMHTADAPALPYVSQWGIMPSITWVSGGGQTFETKGKFEARLLGTKLMCVCSNLINCGVEGFSGNLALMAEPVEGGSVVTLRSENLNNFAYNQVYPANASDYSVMVDVSRLGDGTYRIYLASKAYTETDWQPVHFNETIDGAYLLSVSGGKATITTGIDGVITESVVGKPADNRIYSIDGRYVGTDTDALKEGIYIMNGKKFMR
jgi:hypothetical protein